MNLWLRICFHICRLHRARILSEDFGNLIGAAGFEPTHNNSERIDNIRVKKTTSKVDTKLDNTELEKEQILNTLSQIWHTLSNEQKNIIRYLIS